MGVRLLTRRCPSCKNTFKVSAHSIVRLCETCRSIQMKEKEADGELKIWTNKECSQEFLKSLVDGCRK